MLQQRLRAAKLELMKRKKDMNILQDQQFGGALAQILAADESYESEVVSVSADDSKTDLMNQEKTDLDTYLDTNHPIPQGIAESGQILVPPRLPRPSSRQEQ